MSLIVAIVGIPVSGETKRGDEKEDKSTTASSSSTSVVASKKVATVGSEEGVTEIYCCWKCRHFLFTNLHLMSHEPAVLTHSKHVFADKARQGPV
jgi:hypothetical protein